MPFLPGTITTTLGKEAHAFVRGFVGGNTLESFIIIPTTPDGTARRVLCE
jgi:hypothetical protein